MLSKSLRIKLKALYVCSGQRSGRHFLHVTDALKLSRRNRDDVQQPASAWEARVFYGCQLRRPKRASLNEGLHLSAENSAPHLMRVAPGIESPQIVSGGSGRLRTNTDPGEHFMDQPEMTFLCEVNSAGNTNRDSDRARPSSDDFNL